MLSGFSLTLPVYGEAAREVMQIFVDPAAWTDLRSSSVLVREEGIESLPGPIRFQPLAPYHCDAQLLIGLASRVQRFC